MSWQSPQQWINQWKKTAHKRIKRRGEIKTKLNRRKANRSSRIFYFYSFFTLTHFFSSLVFWSFSFVCSIVFEQRERAQRMKERTTVFIWIDFIYLHNENGMVTESVHKTRWIKKKLKRNRNHSREEKKRS